MRTLLTPTEALILSTIAPAEQYGFAIANAVHSDTGRHLSLGGLYNILARMEDKGLVKSRWGSETLETRRGARRRYYRITPQGQRALATQKPERTP